MNSYDYVIVGAGAAGCVLAHRLSADPQVNVLLVEAGDRNDDPRIGVPRAYAELLADPRMAWQYPTRATGPDHRVEIWPRGRTLGGSSAVNGMIYNRGSQADYDTLTALGNPGWGRDDMLRAFRAVENELSVTTADTKDPVLEDVLAAGQSLGWRRAPDLNDGDDERIGYAVATIHGGRRRTAADAFLHSVEDRPNLAVAVRTVVDRLMVENGTASEVRGHRDGQGFEAYANREVILAAGAIASPLILQRSGIGPAQVLRAAGIALVAESPNVGARLREHRVPLMQFRLREALGYNPALGTDSGRAAGEREYRTTATGPLAAPAFDLVGFFKTRPGLDRPDAQVQIAPWSIEPPAPGRPLQIEREAGMACVVYALRPDSEGSIRITSADPDEPPAIDPGYLSTAHDRAVTAGAVRRIRRLFDTVPLAGRIAGETLPGPDVRSDQELLGAALTVGSAGYHAIATCAMGPADDDVVDPRLRVRGVWNLRVCDASVLPVMVSGNLNGPVSALAWRAADLIQQGK